MLRACEMGPFQGRISGAATPNKQISVTASFIGFTSLQTATTPEDMTKSLDFLAQHGTTQTRHTVTPPMGLAKVVHDLPCN